MLRRAEPENVMDCDLPCRSPAREELTEDAARRAVPHLPGIHELKTAIAARRGMSEDNLQRYDELMDASDAVVDLVRSATVLRIRIRGPRQIQHSTLLSRTSSPDRPGDRGI